MTPGLAISPVNNTYTGVAAVLLSLDDSSPPDLGAYLTQVWAQPKPCQEQQSHPSYWSQPGLLRLQVFVKCCVWAGLRSLEAQGLAHMAVFNLGLITSSLVPMTGRMHDEA